MSLGSEIAQEIRSDMETQQQIRRGYEIVPNPFLLADPGKWLGGSDLKPRPRRPAAEPNPEEPSGGNPESKCPDPIELILYISRSSPRSFMALRNVREVLARFNPARVRLTVCDLSEDPSQGIDDAVAFTPTLVRRSPGPRTFILGHITNPDLILELLADCDPDSD